MNAIKLDRKSIRIQLVTAFVVTSVIPILLVLPVFAVVTIIPVALIFIFMQKYIVSGMTSGAVKG